MAQRLRTFVLYDERGIVIPMSLQRRREYPRIPNVRVLEIGSDICCDDTYTPVISGGTSKMKAFVLVSNKGQVLGGPIIRKNKPKNAKYVQIPYDLCCDSFSTTTTTTSSTSTSSSTTSTTTTETPG